MSENSVTMNGIVSTLLFDLSPFALRRLSMVEYYSYLQQLLANDEQLTYKLEPAAKKTSYIFTRNIQKYMELTHANDIRALLQ